MFKTRLLTAIVAASLLISGTSFSAPAQRRKHRAPDAPVSQMVRTHPPLEGTTHPRPPRVYDVLNYTIRTRFDVPNKTVIGDETVTLKPLLADFKTLELDAGAMQIESVTLDDSNTALQWTQPPEKLSITLPRAFQPAEAIAVRIKYRTKPERGLYFVPASRGNYFALPHPTQIWSQGEPEDNHYWFPCYDFPDDKVTSEQYITTAGNEIAISNGALVETLDNADGTRTFHWKMEQPHGSYLISLVVGEYVKLSDTFKNIPVEYYTYPGTETVARRAFEKTPQMMEWFSRVLNYEYPYNKYAQTVVGSFIFGGMENITATTQSDIEILKSTGSSSSSENLVSHELAHSWFGNLVTCKDWAHAWLNEGFATFMEASFKEHEAGRDAYLSEIQSDADTYFLEDTYRYRRPIVYDRYDQPIDLFDMTLYKKGALILHMLRETVGDELFWKSLNRYLVDNQYRNVTTSDLQRAFEQTTGQQLDWFFNQWVYHAGYPELRVRSSYSPGKRQLTLNVAQTQRAEAMTPEVFRLPVDIELATARGARTEHIEITQRTQSFTFQLDGKPLMIRFDKGEKILKRLDFPRSRAMLEYQRQHSDDLIGRREAAAALARIVRRPASQFVMTANLSGRSGTALGASR
ncbi:MAG TPA: M1 family metallopeptidase [Pyrinomonadaceae bacterium]|jgi:aminopeptidase N|nr:M1 family metallopeptidase [Pyrinomonadaceae bacterium]